MTHWRNAIRPTSRLRTIHLLSYVLLTTIGIVKGFCIVNNKLLPFCYKMVGWLVVLLELFTKKQNCSTLLSHLSHLSHLTLSTRKRWLNHQYYKLYGAVIFTQTNTLASNCYHAIKTPTLLPSFGYKVESERYTVDSNTPNNYNRCFVLIQVHNYNGP